MSFILMVGCLCECMSLCAISDMRIYWLSVLLIAHNDIHSHKQPTIKISDTEPAPLLSKMERGTGLFFMA